MSAKSLFKTTGKVLLTTGAACTTAYLATPMITGALIGVAGGIAGSLASNYIDRMIEGNEIQKALLKTHPSELNHHLQKTLLKAIHWALDNIQVLYTEQLAIPKQQADTRKIIKELKTDVETLLSEDTHEEKDIVAMVDTPLPSLDELSRKVGIELKELPVINPDLPFGDFFSKNFIPQLQLCYAEELKNPNNHEAWVAYQRMMMKDMKTGLQQTIDLNRQLSEKIDQLPAVSTPFPTFSKQQVADLQQLLDTLNHTEVRLDSHFQKALDNLVVDLSGKMDQVLQTSLATQREVIRTREKMDETQTIVRTFNRTLRENWVSKYQVALLITAGVVLIALVGFVVYHRNQPFDSTVVLKKTTTVSSSYPAFTQGDLSIWLGANEEKRPIALQTEALFKHIPAAFEGKSVAVALQSSYWKLAADSVLLTDNLMLTIVPNGTLGTITGNIKTQEGNPIAYVSVTVDSDTTFQSNAQGLFKIGLPHGMQKENYRLTFAKGGYQSHTEFYYPKSGNIDVRLKK
jgi:hypothetical protein